MKIFFILFMNYFCQIENICTNNKDSKQMTEKEYLIEFSKGPCSPIIIIPGLTGTKLIVEINCEELRDQNQETFKTCGFTHCKKKFWEFWKSVPEKEYQLWLTKFNTPLSMESLSTKVSNCFAQFFSIKVDFDKPPEDSLLEQPGFKIKLFGQSEGTRKKGQCGVMACTDLFPIDWYQPRFLRTWHEYFQMLELIGFKRGLTYQILPYDFRKSITNNELNQYFFSNLKRIHQITGKKVLIVGHSYGGPNAYYQIMKLSQEEKDQMIKSMISIGGNFLGSLVGDTSLLVALDYYKLLKYWKLHYYASMKSTSHTISTYEEAMRDPRGQSSEEWYKQIEKRRLYEQYKTENDESDLSFLPRRESICSYYSLYESKCVLGIYDNNLPMVTIMKDIYYKDTMFEMYEKYGYNSDVVKFRKLFDLSEFYKLKNPGVNVLAIVQRGIPTVFQAQWNDDIREAYKNKIYDNPEVNMTHGDGVVDSNSLFYAPIKWAWENQQNLPNSKPIKIIEYCSVYNEKYYPYDNFTGERVINKNEYFGISCECYEDKKRQCYHTNMNVDKNFIKLMYNVHLTYEVSYSEEYQKFIDEFDSSYLKAMAQDDCPQLHV